ncbi:hypothetical protein ABEB36_011748 [Hypothenemus hampei]|uniref:Beta-catenin-interacting ICAT domain-containing protein n=1 Tax=Hypothenemus hampei TaxID=57062 RepID=A0ABD1E920_HYPHA
MSTYGTTETEKLRQNMENQLCRIMEQLNDLEADKDSMDVDEYEETKLETMDQIKALNESFNKLVAGELSLVNSLAALQMAIQAAISGAFKTPEVIRLFSQGESGQLRERLKRVEEDFRLNKLDSESRDQQKFEILTALRQLKEQLSQNELQFLEKFSMESGLLKNMEFFLIQQEC